MQIKRNEIITGLLVLFTLGLALAALLFLVAPGVFHPMKTFEIYFESSSGLKPGSPVLLSGRKIGKVGRIYSPVPTRQRPKEAPLAEVLVEVDVDDEASVYCDSVVRLTQIGVLGEMVVNFSGGNEENGVAAHRALFIGQRVADINEAFPRILDITEPLIDKAILTLGALEKTSNNLNHLLEPNSSLNDSIEALASIGKHVVTLIQGEGPLVKTLKNLEEITSGIAKSDENITQALKNFNDFSLELKGLAKQVEGLSKQAQELLEKGEGVIASGDQLLNTGEQTLLTLTPELQKTLENTSQLTNTLKREPWRLIWPSKKDYEDSDEADSLLIEETLDFNRSRPNLRGRRHRP